jgi:hypothetical protein
MVYVALDHTVCKPTTLLHFYSSAPFVAVQCLSLVVWHRDNSLICFPCFDDNVAVDLEEVCNVNLVGELCIEESSDGVNFQPASFPSHNNLWLSSFDGTGKAAALQSAPQLETNSSSTFTESDGN